MTTVLWFRRDLRIHDNPALVAAVEAAWATGDGNVVPVVLIDPALWPTWGPAKQAYLIDSLRSLDASMGGSLILRHGKAQDLMPAVANEFSATSVHCASDYSGYGIARDNEIAATLAKAGIDFVQTGSGYAVAPGRVTKDDGTYYKVYTPFYKRWLLHGWRAPAGDPAREPNWIGVETCDGYPDRPDTRGVVIPKAGEAAPPVQPKKEKGYRMCDCPNSIRILQAKVKAGLSKNKGRKNKGQHPEEKRTSVKARYCECFWKTNDCSKCKANGCGTDMCKEEDHYTPQYRRANPDFWKRVSNCPTCSPHRFCKIEDHYAVGYFDKGRGHRLKSCCKACKASSQAEVGL